MKQERKNGKKKAILLVGILLLLCIGVGTTALLGNTFGKPDSAPENILGNDTPLAAPSKEAAESIPAVEIPGAENPAQSPEAAPAQNVPAGAGQMAVVPSAEAPVIPAPTASEEVVPSAPAASEEVVPSVPAASEEVVPSAPAASEEAAPSAPVESQQPEPSAPAEEEPTETPAPNKSSVGANWLYQQLFKEGSTIHSYFTSRPSDSKVSLDSEGKNFAPTVNEEMEREGITGSWRIYANSVKKGEYNVFFTETQISEMNPNDKIEEVAKISNYETPGEVVEQTGSATVTERTVEGKTFNTINGGSFEPDAEEPVVETTEPALEEAPEA